MSRKKKWFQAYNNSGMLSVSDNDASLEKARENLAGMPGKVSRAVKGALHRVGDGLKTDAVYETKNRYHLKAREIRDHLVLKKSWGKLNSVILTARGYRKRILEYKVTGKGHDIKVAVRTGEMKTIKTGFLLTKDSGEKVVMHKPEKKYTGHAKAVISPSVPQAVQNKETVAIMRKNTVERFEKRMEQMVSGIQKGFVK